MIGATKTPAEGDHRGWRQKNGMRVATVVRQAEGERNRVMTAADDVMA